MSGSARNSNRLTIQPSPPSRFTRYLFVPAADECIVLCSLSTERLFHPCARVRVDREFVETPDHQGRDDDPLRGSDGVDEGIAKSGAIGRGKS
ncbi:hypothetical protein KCU93_g276, partial [Aureobasidium melanogenum]